MQDERRLERIILKGGGPAEEERPCWLSADVHGGKEGRCCGLP